MKKTIIAYIPVLHQGYLDWLDKHRAEADTLLIFGPEIIVRFDHLKRKDLRAVDPMMMHNALRSFGLFRSVELLDNIKASLLAFRQTPIVMPDEPECRQVASKLFSSNQVIFEPVFLRWHAENTLKKNVVAEDVAITVDELDRSFVRVALTEADRSLDWWRQVGGVLVKDGQIVLAARNRHVPDERMPYVNGDPRANFKKGIAIELSTAEHAEAAIIAEAANRGMSTAGAALYVTTFPCPPCANLIAHSGIKKLFFADGYSMLDGEKNLRSKNVEIVRVMMEPV